MPPELWLALPIVFGAVLCRATFGFGDALLAMPPLVLLIGAERATPLVGGLAATSGVVILASSWRDVAWRDAWQLVVASGLMVPVGFYVLRLAPEWLIKGVLGVVVLGYGIYALRKGRTGREILSSPAWAWPFGAMAGLLGGAYNTNGPPAVVYGTLRGWDPKTFRSTLQGYFLPTSAIIVTTHVAGGAWTREVFTLFLGAFPLALLALGLGHWLHPKIPAGRFDKALYALLLVMGVALLAFAVRGAMAPAG